MNFVDLFCGIGGLSLGLENAGHKNVFSTDYWSAAELNNNSKNFLKLDLFHPNSQEIIINKIKQNKAELIVGGPPCQGFSSFGKRKTEDRRNTLVDIFLKIITKSNPKIIIIENVRGLTSMEHPNGLKFNEHIKRVLESKQNKYFVQIIHLDGLKLGMGQNRKRIFYLGIKKDILNNQENKQVKLTSFIEKFIKTFEKNSKTLKEVISDLPKIESGDECIDKNIKNHTPFIHQDEIIKRIKYVPEGGGLQDIPDNLLNGHLFRMKNNGYGSGGLVKNTYGRLSWDKPSGTIIAGVRKITCGRLFHPEANRLLTVRECARLQTIPDHIEIKGSITEQYTLVGNAVPPLFSKILGSLILELQKINLINV